MIVVNDHAQGALSVRHLKSSKGPLLLLRMSTLASRKLGQRPKGGEQGDHITRRARFSLERSVHNLAIKTFTAFRSNFSPIQERDKWCVPL